MSQLVVKEPARVIIGVCGEQASGKTVFETCVFQSIWTAVSNDLMIDFDRKEVGNATYFQSVEDELIRKGPAPGTRLLFPARIYIKPYEVPPGMPRPVLSVDLLDFAGGHFRAIADLKHLLDESAADPEEQKALREVNETLEQADAFVILINSREIDPDDPTPKRNPFSPSVNFILAHCRAERKPVALLFSQIDQTPSLTEDVLHRMPRVEKFEQQFTDDLDEATSTGGRPYGIVRRISCYETTEDGITPRKQDDGGNIWRPEPAAIILDLLRATMPVIMDRLRLEEAKAAQQRADEQITLQQKRKRQWIAVSATLAALILALAILAFAAYRRNEGRQVRLLETVTSNLRDGEFSEIPPLAPRVVQLLITYRQNPGGTGSAVRSAVRELESEAAAAAQRLVAQPALLPVYGANIGHLETLAPHLDPAVSDELQRAILPVLVARREFLSGWFGASPLPHRARARGLNEAAQHFGAGGDPSFSDLLNGEATRAKKTEVASWQALVDADPDVETRLATIQRIAGSALQDSDPEFIRLARNALAEQVMTTILKRSENGFLREKLLTPLLPDLARFGDGEVRFDVLASDLLNCSSQYECASRRAVVQSASNDAIANADRWRSAVENLLRSLLLDLPPDQRRDVWNAVAGSLVRSYFFSGRNDAWPDGVVPLHAYVVAVANAESDGTIELIDRLSQSPVYAAEMEYLNDRLAATEVRRRMVPIYSSILSALSIQNSLLPFDELTQVSNEVSSSFAGREPNGSLAEIAGELDQVLGLVQSVNSLRSKGSFGDSLTPSRLERLLREAKRVHCGALVSHEIPTECADAA
jgi:hypothetical protein